MMIAMTAVITATRAKRIDITDSEKPDVRGRIAVHFPPRSMSLQTLRLSCGLHNGFPYPCELSNSTTYVGFFFFLSLPISFQDVTAQSERLSVVNWVMMLSVLVLEGWRRVGASRGEVRLAGN